MIITKKQLEKIVDVNDTWAPNMMKPEIDDMAETIRTLVGIVEKMADPQAISRECHLLALDFLKTFNK
jgi:hypothetical protein